MQAKQDIHILAFSFQTVWERCGGYLLWNSGQFACCHEKLRDGHCQQSKPCLC